MADKKRYCKICGTELDEDGCIICGCEDGYCWSCNTKLKWNGRCWWCSYCQRRRNP